MTDLPLSLYLHFPWCVQKCPYCDFNSHALRGDTPEDAYVEALVRDLDHELREPESRPLTSIFMGGGTPSLFSDRAIGRVLEAVQRRLAFAPDIEITLEANPGTADASHFRGYRTAGVNRLSIGVQSLDAAQLKKLGRIHDPGQAVAALELARAAGFDNVNLDLMFALPQQSEAQALADLDGVLALQPEHVSWYQLTLEPNTEFAARPPPLPDDDAVAAMFDAGQARLAAAGYAQYEVSAYARPGRQARHNLNYWEFGDYLGIGAGAHGKRSGAAGVIRRARHKHPKRYLESAGTAAGVQEERILSAQEMPIEFMLNVLRLNAGVPAALWEARTGLPLAALATPLAEARRLGLMEPDPGLLRPTALGHRHLNRLLELFLDA
ncbi:oxygen-independent coproporphyrinogen III oxidase-like protein [Solimonas sp. K1W22B-7]|uniref:radical SAM family heme chaperone HemW n=1 Tax=Solimonas sp. K1W22B-7 TaxID=2303331 RepID=UPI000E331F0E|nr:radical SAM family heme chaperone HemW [Solimonas sp. K1W22B-7]AXQ27296.1 oxygen-independent coproporphyrinogen III oxidase-like protein [Solimonas sp. K1W22B-7]